MAKATYDDANLMVQVLQWWAMADLNSALNWMFSDDFIMDYDEFIADYPPGSEGYGHVQNILGAMESLGTLVKNDLFNEDLAHDWLGSHLVWRRIGSIALGLRKDTGEPRLYENFEALAKASASA
jgi:hypothetical protein